MGRHYKNSIVVRTVHRFPTADWFTLMEDLFNYVQTNARGEVSTCPGPGGWEVDWFFEFDEDAAWFILRHGGKILKVEGHQIFS